MKKSRNMVLCAEVAEIMKKEGLPLDHSSMSSWCMSQVYKGTHYAGKYGKLKQGDFALYFREFHGKKAE